MERRGSGNSNESGDGGRRLQAQHRRHHLTGLGGGVTEGEGESGISGRKSSEGEGDGARTLTMGLVCEFIVGLRDFIS